MNAAAIDRIHQRIANSQGGSATADGPMRWEISLPEDDENEDSPRVTFHNELLVEDGSVTVQCDARLDRYTPDQAGVVATFQASLATALKRDGVTFASFEDLTSFLKTEVGAKIEDGLAEIAPDSDDATPVFVTTVIASHEPWVSFAIAFVDDADPVWLMEQNGLLTHLHFEVFEGDTSLVATLPLASLTGQRVIEVVEDLFLYRELLIEDLEGDDEDEDEDDE
ncbi:Hypothetical protein A7982_00766 [Minicystis rosea]|nr:Hypothetical protein A7982_00766 [Minicystis rosea]